MGFNDVVITRCGPRVIAVAGVIDYLTVPQFQSALFPLTRSVGDLAIDLRGLRLLGSVGANAILEAVVTASTDSDRSGTLATPMGQRSQSMGRCQVKMLTPPGPTSSPTTIRTMPHRISLRNSATMPAITKMTAMIHKMNATSITFQFDAGRSSGQRVPAQQRGQTCRRCGPIGYAGDMSDVSG